MATTATAVCTVIAVTAVAIVRPDLAEKAIDTIKECVTGRSGREEKRDIDKDMSSENIRGRGVNY